MKIALFTPFSPALGGGSAQLRSHFRALSDLDVVWHYLAPEPAANANPNWKRIGQPFRPSELLSDLSARTGFLPGAKAHARRIVEQIEADLFWVVGHYEGLSVAAELCDQGRPLHLTVHDDPFGTWKRSQRYRFFSPLLHRTFPRILQRAKSIDVTSWGMRNLYREKYGVKCFSLYLHVPELPVLRVRPDSDRLTIGHIGTLYQLEPFRRFLNACRKIAAEDNRSLRVIRIGTSAEWLNLPSEAADSLESHGDLEEQHAIPLLATCDLLYAMYPPGRKYDLFRKTSLPIKLSTYVQAQRPIFVHSPLDSGLARVLDSARVGCVCSSLEETAIAAQIRQTLDATFARESFELLRQELMGPEQVQKLRAALRSEDWQRFPENNFRS